MAHQVLFQPDSTRTDNYCVYVDDMNEYRKWLDGDTTIALASFVGRFEVYHSMQGAQGQWNPASKGQMASDLGSEDKDECLKIVLKEGGKQSGDRLAKGVGRTKEGGHMNAAREGVNVISTGSMGGNHGQGGR